ncbi:hypothetical protein J2774_004471 [Rhizobium pusense]|nr:hypothetical protein [Agrobacterium pusense]
MSVESSRAGAGIHENQWCKHAGCKGRNNLN